jgi:hypothetical protein
MPTSQTQQATEATIYKIREMFVTIRNAPIDKDISEMFRQLDIVAATLKVDLTQLYRFYGAAITPDMAPTLQEQLIGMYKTELQVISETIVNAYKKRLLEEKKVQLADIAAQLQKPIPDFLKEGANETN